MPIKVTCNSCRASFSARDDLAGKKVACPKCKQPLVIPAPADAGMGDLLDEIGLGRAAAGGGGRRCPSCGAQMPAHGVVCVECGYNVQTGRRVSRGDGGESERTKQLLRRAEEELRKSPEQQSDEDYGEGASAYLVSSIIGTIASVMVGSVILISYYAAEMSPWRVAAYVMLLVYLGGALFAYVDTIVSAFRISPLHGGLCFIPIYGYYFAIIKSIHRPIFVMLVTWNFLLFAAILIALAQAFAGTSGAQTAEAGAPSQTAQPAFKQCPYCGTRNDASASTCVQCKSNLPKGSNVIGVLGILLFTSFVLGWDFVYWGWVRITGLAFQEQYGSVTHGTLSLLVPGYAYGYGFFRNAQPYMYYASLGAAGCMMITIPFAYGFIAYALARTG